MHTNGSTATLARAIRAPHANGAPNGRASGSTGDALREVPGAVPGAGVPGADRIADMRRRRNAEAAELVVRRAEFLAPEDRALLRAIYADGLSIAQVALLRQTGTPESRSVAAPGAGTPGSAEEARPGTSAGSPPGAGARRVRARVRALVERALSPMFVFVASRQADWTPTRRRVAQAVYLHGMTLREAASALGVSLHVVRRHADAVRTLAEEHHSASR